MWTLVNSEHAHFVICWKWNWWKNSEQACHLRELSILKVCHNFPSFLLFVLVTLKVSCLLWSKEQAYHICLSLSLSLILRMIFNGTFHMYLPSIVGVSSFIIVGWNLISGFKTRYECLPLVFKMVMLMVFTDTRDLSVILTQWSYWGGQICNKNGRFFLSS